MHDLNAYSRSLPGSAGIGPGSQGDYGHSGHGGMQYVQGSDAFGNDLQKHSLNYQCSGSTVMQSDGVTQAYGMGDQHAHGIMRQNVPAHLQMQPPIPVQGYQGMESLQVSPTHSDLQGLFSSNTSMFPPPPPTAFSHPATPNHAHFSVSAPGPTGNGLALHALPPVQHRQLTHPSLAATSHDEFGPGRPNGRIVHAQRNMSLSPGRASGLGMANLAIDSTAQLYEQPPPFQQTIFGHGHAHDHGQAVQQYLPHDQAQHYEQQYQHQHQHQHQQVHQGAAGQPPSSSAPNSAIEPRLQRDRSKSIASFARYRPYDHGAPIPSPTRPTTSSTIFAEAPQPLSANHTGTFAFDFNIDPSLTATATGAPRRPDEKIRSEFDFILKAAGHDMDQQDVQMQPSDSAFEQQYPAYAAPTFPAAQTAPALDVQVHDHQTKSSQDQQQEQLGHAHSNNSAEAGMTEMRTPPPHTPQASGTSSETLSATSPESVDADGRPVLRHAGGAFAAPPSEASWRKPIVVSPPDKTPGTPMSVAPPKAKRKRTSAKAGGGRPRASRAKGKGKADVKAEEEKTEVRDEDAVMEAKEEAEVKTDEMELEMTFGDGGQAEVALNVPEGDTAVDVDEEGITILHDEKDAAARERARLTSLNKFKKAETERDSRHRRTRLVGDLHKELLKLYGDVEVAWTREVILDRSGRAVQEVGQLRTENGDLRQRNGQLHNTVNEKDIEIRLLREQLGALRADYHHFVQDLKSNQIRA